MNYVAPNEHPDVLYWACPERDCKVMVVGSQFGFLAAMGMTVEPADLVECLPPSLLDEAETAVEEHERSHLAATA